MRACMHTQIHECTYARVYMYMYMDMYIHTYIHNIKLPACKRSEEGSARNDAGVVFLGSVPESSAQGLHT